MFRALSTVSIFTITPLAGLLGLNKSIDIYKNNFSRNSLHKLYPITERNLKKLIKIQTGTDYKIKYIKFNNPNAAVNTIENILYLGDEEIRAVNKYLTYSSEPKSLKDYEKYINRVVQYLLGFINDLNYIRYDDKHSELEYYTDGVSSYLYNLEKKRFYDQNMILGVLYHEIGHIKEKDSQKIMKEYILNGLFLFGTTTGTTELCLYYKIPILFIPDILFLNTMVCIGLYLYSMKKSRDIERKADKNIVDPDLINGSIIFHKKMFEKFPFKRNFLINLMCSHPSHLERIETFKKRLTDIEKSY